MAMHSGRITKTSCAALLMMIVLSACNQAPPSDGLQEGSLIPPLTLTGLDGKQVLIDSFRGKLVVLNIWATWCAPCRHELPSLERLHQRLDPQRFVVAGLSVDNDVLQAREYLLDKGITFTSYIDQDMKIATDILAVRIFPDTVILSPQGVVLRRIAGERVWDQSRVIKALEEAYAGNEAPLAGL
jgi:thiol-disulfide isomerase/thioredoxin